jgi:hypothetical protein
VGTAAALFLAANAPDRVASLTIGGGAVRVPIDAGGALKDVIEAPSLDVVRQLDARTNIGFAVEPAAGTDSEPDVHEDYVSAYDLGRFAESARFVRHYPEQNPALRELLPTITTPAQIIAGRDDDLVPWSNNEYLADLLPNSEIHPLDAGHFAWEQASEDYGRLIVDWVTGGFQRVVVFNRHLHRAEGMVRHFGKSAAHMDLRAMPWHESVLEAELSKTKLLVNATSIGLVPGQTPIPAELLPPDLLVLDLIYNPSQSQLLKDAAAARDTVLNGEHMLLQQGAKSFELWTGKAAPIEVMQAELDRAREHGLRQLPIDMGPAGVAGQTEQTAAS